MSQERPTDGAKRRPKTKAELEYDLQRRTVDARYDLWNHLIDLAVVVVWAVVLGLLGWFFTDIARAVAGKVTIFTFSAGISLLANAGLLVSTTAFAIKNRKQSQDLRRLRKTLDDYDPFSEGGDDGD